MKPVLAFIIPVRHPDNSRDWAVQIRNLTDTAASISNQDHAGWRAIVVANSGSRLPPLPAGFEIEWVDFPPNPLHEQEAADVEKFRDALRLDKGRRILAGLLKARDSRFIMVVDDDDFVSRRLTGFAAGHPDANGWFIRDGLVWSDGGRLVYRHDDFSNLCGTSHIIRADLLEIPADFEAASDTYIRRMLGSHIFIDKHLAALDTPLAPLPFAGAVYRVGHAVTVSRSQGIVRSFVFDRRHLRQPLELASRIMRLRPITAGIRREFFGRHGSQPESMLSGAAGRPVTATEAAFPS